MGTLSNDIRVIKEWKVEGTDENGQPEITTVRLTEDKTWTPDAEVFRYEIARSVNGGKAEYDGADERAEAIAIAKDWVRDARQAARSLRRALAEERAILEGAI